MKGLKSKYDIWVEVCCLMCLIGSLVYLLTTWDRIPDEIPGHYNAMGEIDRMTSKRSLIALPVITWIMYAGMTAIAKFPQIWNIGITVTEANKEKVYRVLKDMLGTNKVIVVATFTYLTVHSALAKPLSALFLPLFLSILFGSLLFFFIKLISIK